MDFIFGFPKDSLGRSGILVFVDRASKMTHLCAVETTVTAVEAARLFYDCVFARHGMPTSLVSDRDKLFTSQFWRALFTLLGSKLHMSTTDHPQSDGQTERVNRVVEDILRSYAQGQPRRWSELLPSVEFAINNATHSSTGYTPFYLNYLRHPRLPLSLDAVPDITKTWDASFRGSPSKSPAPGALRKATSAIVDSFHSDRMSLLAQVRDALADAQDNQRRFADANGRNHTDVFKVNDLVLLSTKSLPREAVSHALGCKLIPRFLGPYRVLDRIGEVSYRLELPPKLRLHPTFYVGRLKRYEPSPEPPTEVALPSASSPRFQELPSVSLAPPSGPSRTHRDPRDCPTAPEPGPRSPGATGVGPPPNLRPGCWQTAAAAPSAASSPLARDEIGETPPVGRRGSPPSEPVAGSSKAQPVRPDLCHEDSEPLGSNHSRPATLRSTPPAVFDSSGRERFLVESVVAEKGKPRSRGHQFLVKWRGYPATSNSWEPASILNSDVPGLVRQFYERRAVATP